MPLPIVPIILRFLLPIVLKEAVERVVAKTKEKEIPMNEATLGLIRHVLTFGGGILVAQGKLDPGSIEVLAGAITSIIGVFWSIWAKRKAA